MTAGLRGLPIVVDTVIISWLLSRNPQLAPNEPHITGRQIVISFITVAELRYGAVKGNWGDARRQRLEERISSMRVVTPDNDLVNAYVDMRAKCQQLGPGRWPGTHCAPTKGRGKKPLRRGQLSRRAPRGRSVVSWRPNAVAKPGRGCSRANTGYSRIHVHRRCLTNPFGNC